ncbi:MAG: TonB-dependent receptor [Bacteroidales bacterium]|nr:TonB-dependent receptor [Bacteroidales bacterium]
MKQLVKNFCMAVVLFCAAAAAFAQVTTSSMSGTVVDVNGDPVVGATVVATHTPSGTQYFAVADGKGMFRILSIRPGGPYTVSIEMMGFVKVEQTGISVALSDNYVLNATMQEDSMTLDAAVVTVEGKNSNMRSDRAGAMTNLDMTQLASLPVLSRSISDVVKLTPQSYDSGSGPQIGGGTYRQNFFTIDGAAANNAFGIGESMPVGGSVISMDAIEQISVNVTPYDVRQSGFIGGSMAAVTRSGSNQFEASAYMYYYDQDFRGNRVGDVKLDLSKETNMIYGVRVGGPIIKNKLFFFANFEMESNVTPGPSHRASTEANPYTNGSDNISRPSASVMDALSGYLKKNYGYDPGLYQGYSSEAPGWKLLARLDWNINNNHKFNIRYTNTKSKYVSAPSTSTSGLGDRNFTTKNRLANTAMYFQNARYYQEQNFSSFAAELNSRFLDGRMNNMLRATYSHQYEPRSVEGGFFPFVDVVVAGDIYTSFGTELFSYGNLRDVQTFNITDELSYSAGIHNLFAGVQYEWNLTKNGFQRFGAGYYTFLFDSENDLMSAMNNNTLFADPHQFAITHSLEDPNGQSYPRFTFNQLSFYLQDEIAISDRFKLTAGLRLELPMYPDLSYNYSKQVADATFAEYNGNGGKYDTRQLPSTQLMFSPRIGFNWDITGDRNYILRGGTGLFTGRLPFVWIVAQAGDSGVIQTTYTAVKGEEGKVLPAFTDNRKEMIDQVYDPNAQALSISSITLMADDLRMPQTWKTSLAMDVRLPGDVMATLEGIYNYDIDPVTITNVGLKDPTLTNIQGYADNRYVWGDVYDKKIKNAYLLHNADKHGHYYSLTAKLEKNNWYGFNGMVAYTYSSAQSLSDGFGDQVYSAWNSANTVNGQNMLDLGYASYVMPHRLIASLGYRVEYGKNFATSINLLYDGGPRSRASYTYTKNIVGDGGANNLIYVPKTKDELQFADYEYTDASKNKVVYTADQQREDFWNYVEQDPYLRTRKGQYAERNGLIFPWVHQFDLRITQDFYLKMQNGQRNTLQLGLDVRNLGALLNPNWGQFVTMNRSSILEVAKNGWSKDGDQQPVFKFMRNGTEVLDKTFTPSVGTASTYLIQLSVRYIFK